MKRFAFLLLLLWSGDALAQAPQELTFPNAQIIKLRPGETRIFRFGTEVNRLDLTDDNIVDVTRRSDGIFAFKGVKPGDTIVSAQSDNGKTVHQMRVVVGDNQVKIYGNSADVSDYVGFECNEYGCGPAIENGAKAKSTTIRTPLRGGGFVDRTY